MNPQLENGYTRVANPIIEQLNKVPFKGCELAICWHIIRQTYGYHKLVDTISISQFQEALGRSRPTIIKGLKVLVAMNIVKVVNTGLLGKAWKFNKYCDTWVVKTPLPLVKRKGVQLVKTGLHTKEIDKRNNTDSLKSSSEKPMRMSDTRKFSTDYEETITLDGEKIPDKADVEHNQLKADVDRVIQEYTTQFIDRVDSADRIPKMAVPALRKIIKNTLKIYTADEIIENIPTYFRSQFYKNSGWALWTLCSPKVINQLKNDPNR